MVVSSTHKTALILVTVVVISCIVGWFGYSKWYLPRYAGPPSHKAVGMLKTEQSGTLILSGIHVPDTPPPFGSQLPPQRDLTVHVTPQTKLVKSIWQVPVSLAKLAFGSAKVDPASIKKTQQPGSIDDLKNVTGVSMTVMTATNSAYTAVLDASEIDYTVYQFAQ